MIHEALTIVRGLNIALGLVCFTLCLLKASSYWTRFNGVAKGFTAALTLFSFATVWGTSEQLALHVAPGSRVVVTFVACLFLLSALWRTRGQSFYVEFTPENRVR